MEEKEFYCIILLDESYRDIMCQSYEPDHSEIYDFMRNFIEEHAVSINELTVIIKRIKVKIFDLRYNEKQQETENNSKKH